MTQVIIVEDLSCSKSQAGQMPSEAAPECACQDLTTTYYDSNYDDYYGYCDHCYLKDLLREHCRPPVSSKVISSF